MFGDTIKGTPAVLVARSQREVTEICFFVFDMSVRMQQF